MKKKWKLLSKLQRKMIIYIGLLNLGVLLFQLLCGFWLSWWLFGVGCGFYIMFLLDCFCFFNTTVASDNLVSYCDYDPFSKRCLSCLDCVNPYCDQYDKECSACKSTEVSGNG